MMWSLTHMVLPLLLCAVHVVTGQLKESMYGPDVISCPTPPTVCEVTLNIAAQIPMVWKDVDDTVYNVGVVGCDLCTIPNNMNAKDPAANLGHVLSETEKRDVITLDGHVRNVITINGRFGGPTIEVTEGQEMKVTVINNLLSDTITIHWHGIHQRDTPFMDGVPYVTQCPILPGYSFCYTFTAEPAGTHWYHSHLHAQHMDGLFGMLVVNPVAPKPPQPKPCSFAVSVKDWWQVDSDTFEFAKPEGVGAGEYSLPENQIRYHVDQHRVGEHMYWTTLINGRGRENFADVALPLDVFKVNADDIVRFRVAHTGAEYHYAVSIDSHLLTVVAVDGGEILPISGTHYAVIYPGETIDFEVEMDQLADNYWFRARTFAVTKLFPDCHLDGAIQEGRAIVNYDGVPVIDPVCMEHRCTSAPCVVFNCPFGHFGNWVPPHFMNMQCVSMDTSMSAYGQAFLNANFGVNVPPDTEYFFNFNAWNGATINCREFVSPRFPLFQRAKDCNTPNIVPCNGCSECSCTHIKTLGRDDVIQLVLINMFPLEGLPAPNPPEGSSHHPVHLHGHSFAVMKIGYPVQDPITGKTTAPNPDITCNNACCDSPTWSVPGGPALNSNLPPLKDTVIVPADGYTIVRLISDNPGYWMMHCHIADHIASMALIFEEGEPHIPKLPKKKKVPTATLR